MNYLSGRLIVTTAADQHDQKFPALIRLANNQLIGTEQHLAECNEETLRYMEERRDRNTVHVHVCVHVRVYRTIASTNSG